MKRLVIVFQILLCALNMAAQGIEFTENLSWDQIIQKAQKENKKIFVDCYATYCIPCKVMDREVYSQKPVGDFFNKEFVNVKIQFDTSGMQKREVQSMYPIARLLEKKYKVLGFPTYLFFDSNGNILNQEMGEIKPYALFLQKTQDLLDPNEQYYAIRKRYEQGDRGPELVKKLMKGAVKFQDWKTAFLAHDQFVGLIDTPYKKDDLFLIYSSIPNSDGAGFRVMLKNMKRNDSILDDEGRAKSVIKAHLKKEANDLFFKGKSEEVNWAAVQSYIQSRAPELMDQTILELKIKNAFDRKMYEEFGRLKMDYYDKYSSGFDHNARFFMNNELMQVLMVCSDKETLKRASKYSKMSIYVFSDKANSEAIDTYANFLYKLGKVKKAIKWQEHAIEIVSKHENADVSEYVDNLNKMKAGIPTWIIQ